MFPYEFILLILIAFATSLCLMLPFVGTVIHLIRKEG